MKALIQFICHEKYFEVNFIIFHYSVAESKGNTVEQASLRAPSTISRVNRQRQRVCKAHYTIPRNRVELVQFDLHSIITTSFFKADSEGWLLPQQCSQSLCYVL